MFLKNTFHESLSIIFLFICILLPSCATVSVYNIDLKYEPTKQATKPHVAPDRILFTITEFKDLRKTDNEIIIGKVVDTKGKEIPIASLTQRPAQAIPKAFKDALLRVGFNISDAMPQWDLKESSIKGEWERIIIGGEINKLELIVKDGIATKHYETEIKLKLFVGDNKRMEIFQIPSYETNSKITDVAFSEERAQRYVNSTLSALIERIIKDGEFWDKIINQLKK